MKEWSGTLQKNDVEFLSSYAPLDEILLFDIETTGLSAKTSYCYMIGYCYLEKNESNADHKQEYTWNYRMLFNEDGRSELDMLTDFAKVLSRYTLLIHYNGDGFDIPYLTEKYRQYVSFGFSFQNQNPFEAIKSLDLYKFIRPYKNGLALSNLKLPTIEQALGLVRHDQYNGGELIPIYRRYIQQPSDESEHHLFQHNYEDICAMIPLLQLLTYRQLEECDFQLGSISYTDSNAPALEFILKLKNPLPLPYRVKQGDLTLKCAESSGILTIPIKEAELRYYVENWKDYFYLPMEDTVIHKSMAAYVDSEFKEKAKKTNCYLKKTGQFLPLPYKATKKNQKQEFLSILPTDTKLYQASLEQPEPYLEWKEELLSDTDFLTKYCRYFIQLELA